MIKKSIIVACNQYGVIGKGNKMPWYLPGDLKMFKLITNGHPVIMGSKTYESIGKPLSNRTNIVVSHKYFDDVVNVSSIEDAYNEAEKVDTQCFIIGGAQLYNECINDVDELYITLLMDVIVENPDTYFPEISSKDWYISSIGSPYQDSESGIVYYHLLFKRKK